MNPKADYIEDVSISPDFIGPRIKRSFDPFKFEVDFSSAPRDHFLDKTELADGRTVGQSRRDQIVELLIVHIEDFSSRIIRL